MDYDGNVNEYYLKCRRPYAKVKIRNYERTSIYPGPVQHKSKIYVVYIFFVFVLYCLHIISIIHNRVPRDQSLKWLGAIEAHSTRQAHSTIMRHCQLSAVPCLALLSWYRAVQQCACHPFLLARSYTKRSFFSSSRKTTESESACLRKLFKYEFRYIIIM